MRRSPAVLLTAAALALSAPAAGAQTFDFESVPFGTLVPFTDTDGGVTASFTAPGGNFAVLSNPGAFVGLIGQYLSDADADIIISPLEIAFSTFLNSISLNFAMPDLLGTGTGTLTLDAFLGATLVGSTSQTGAIPPGFGAIEGSITFAGGMFDRVVLSADIPDFGIDNVNVAPAAVPEPATVALLAGGLLVIGAVGRRRLRA